MLRFRERDGEWHPGPFDFGAADRVIVGTLCTVAVIVAAIFAAALQLPAAIERSAGIEADKQEIHGGIR